MPRWGEAVSRAIEEAAVSAPHLEWRIRIFGAGAILGLVGMWAGAPWLVNVAIGVLGIGVVFRLLSRRSHPPAEDDEAPTA